MEGPHTGSSLANHVIKTLEEYDLQGKLLAITLDNASNNGTLLKSVEQRLLEKGIKWNSESGGIRCLAHVIQLAVNSFLKVLKANPNNDFINCELNNTQLDKVSNEISYVNVFHKVYAYLL